MKARALGTRIVCVSIIVLAVLSIYLGQHVTFTTSHPASPVNPTVTLSGERIMQGSPAAADFDGDGDKEIVIGGRDGMLYVLAYEGASWSVVWSQQVAQVLNAAGAPTGCAETTKSDIRSAPAIADIDNDNDLDIVVTTGGDPGRSGDPGTSHRNGGVLVYSYVSDNPWQFSLMPGWPQPKLDIVGLGAGASKPDGCWDGIWGSPALADLDGDNDFEVLVEGLDRRLHVWHHDGTYVEGWPIKPPQVTRGGWSSPAVGDLDKDEELEIVFATDNHPDAYYYLYAFESDATVMSGFPVKAEQNLKSSPALGDIDGDSWLDIVVGTGTYEAEAGNKVYAWDHNGQPLAGWPQTTAGKMPASPALGDLDGDGDLEVVIGCGAEGDPYDPPACTQLYAWHGNGQPVTGFPVRPDNNNPWPSDSLGMPVSVVLVDYDGDNNLEILAPTRWSNGLSTVNHNGVNENNTDLQTQAQIYSPALVDDVDGDGSLEIVVGGATSGEANGAVYVWDMASTTANSQPWPMFRHDVARTGLFSLPPELPVLGFPESVYLYHQAGSSSTTETTWVSIWNEGAQSFDWTLTPSTTTLQLNPSSGTLTERTVTKLTLDASGLPTDKTVWIPIGTIAATATFDGVPISGSPKTANVYVFVGNVSYGYLPFVIRD